jgi:tetratricopeptide (TPR) repeat protein
MSGVMDVDTRSDVYSLGVMLYELLTGTTPFDKHRLATAAYDEVRRIIREEEPPRPSTRLSTLGATLTTVSAQRDTDPKQLGRSMRGELDWIVMRALEKDRARRYETVNGLARDVPRYLAGDPPVARPASTWYLVRRRIRKHWLPFSVATVTVSLLLGMGVFSYVRIAAQRRTAERLRAEAVNENDNQRSVNVFMTVGVTRAARAKSSAETLTVFQMTQEAVRQMDWGMLRGRPLLEALARYSVGSSLHSLGHHSEALNNLNQSLSIRRKYLPSDHVDIADTLDVIAEVRAGQGDWDHAEAALRESVEIRRRLLPSGQLGLALSLARLAGVIRTPSAARAAEAESIDREALAILRREKAIDFINHSLEGLAADLFAQGKLSEAESAWREIAGDGIVDETRLINQTQYVASNAGLAQVLYAQGKPKEAEKHYRDALEFARTHSLMNAEVTAEAAQKLGGMLKKERRLPDAATMYRLSIDIRLRASEKGDRHTGTAISSLASILQSTGRARDANELCDQIVPRYLSDLQARRHEDGDSFEIASALVWAASAYQAAGRYADAEPLLRESLAIRRKLFGPASPEALRAQSKFSELLRLQGKLNDVEKLWEDFIDVQRKIIGNSDKALVEPMNSLASARRDNNHPADAEVAAKQCIAVARKTLPAQDSALAGPLGTLGWSLSRQGRPADAEPFLREALEIAEKKHRPFAIADSQWLLGESFALQGKYADAEQLMLKGAAGLKESTPVQTVRRKDAYGAIVRLYEAWGTPEKAATWRSKLAAVNQRAMKPPAIETE